MTAAPARDEAAPYFFNYIDLVPAGDIVMLLRAQLDQTLPLLATITEAQSLHRYAPDKWSLREVLGHLNDCERLFTFRALWFARGFDSALPSFDDKVAALGAAADRIAWSDHLEEFRALRTATIALFRGLPADGWDRRGIASGSPFTVRALAFIAEGHVRHHLAVIRERYLPPTQIG